MALLEGQLSANVAIDDYYNQVISAPYSCVHYWRFDEADTTSNTDTFVDAVGANDLNRSANTGRVHQIAGAVADSNTGYAQDRNQTLTLDTDTTQYNQITVMGFFKVAVAATAASQTIRLYAPSNAATLYGLGIALLADAGSGATWDRANIRGSAGGATFTNTATAGSPITYATDTWYHFAIRWNGTTAELWINGALFATHTPGTSGNLDYTTGLVPKFNQQFSNTSSWGATTDNLSYDEYSVHNVALTDQQIQDAYAARLVA